jgi:hypothetical protein
MSKLKEHYMAYYRQMRKDFLDYLEDFATEDSLIGSTSTRSKKTLSCASKISSPSDVSEDTKVSKSSNKPNVQDFYPKHLNHAFMPKPDFDGYRNDVKKDYENDPYPLGVDEHQVPDHALLSACQGGVGCIILMENRGKQDGIRSCYQLVNQYETDGNKNVRMKKLDNVITTVFHQHYKGGLFKWIQDYEDAFTELVILGQVTWNDDNIKKRCLVQNAQNIGMVDTVFEALVSHS